MAKSRLATKSCEPVSSHGIFRNGGIPDDFRRRPWFSNDIWKEFESKTEQMIRKNQIEAEAEYRCRTGHLVLTKFELTADGKLESTMKSGEKCEFKFLPSLLRLLIAYSAGGEMPLKRSPPWNRLWDMIRKIINGTVATEWSRSLFGRTGARLVFQEAQLADNKRIPFNRGRFPPKTVSVRIQREDSRDYYTEVEALNLLDGLICSKSKSSAPQIDRAYAYRLASELQVQAFTDSDASVAIGKSIWLSHLTHVQDLLRAVIAEDGMIHTLRSILTQVDQSDTSPGTPDYLLPREGLRNLGTRLSGIARVIGCNNLRESAMRVGLRFDDIEAQFTAVVRATLLSVDESGVSIDTLRKVVSDVGEKLNGHLVELNEKMAECRSALGELWEKCGL